MIDLVMGVIGAVFYPLFAIVFVAIDGIQGLFYAFAGIGEISFNNYGTTITGTTQIGSGNSGAETDTGILYYLMHHSIVRNLLLSIMLLGFFLIIVFTVMAFIKNAYAAKQKGWKEIIGNALKGLANFIFLPVCCLLGVWLGNILLQAINGATSTGGSTMMSRKLFTAAAYNANWYRNAGTEGKDVLENAYNLALYRKDQLPFDKSDIKDGLTNEEYANMLDDLYASGCISIYDYVSVNTGYASAQINYIVIIVGGIFMLYALGSITFAMVRRIFILLTLFVVSPGVCAMYPLDEGKAVQSWAGEVKKSILSAYGAVAGMNIFYSILPLVDNIHLGGNDFWAFMSSGFISDLLQIFIMVSGLMVVKELISMISGFVGGEDAYAKGSSLMKSTAGAMKKYGGGAVKAVSAFSGRVKGRMEAGHTGKQAFWGEVGKSFKGLGGKAVSAVTGGVFDPKDMKKSYDDAKKDAKEHAWDSYDARSDTQKRVDEEKFKSLLVKGQKTDMQAVYEFLNGVQDENAKKKYEEKIIAHNNRVAANTKVADTYTEKEANNANSQYIHAGDTKTKFNKKTGTWDNIMVKGEGKLDKAGSYIENAKAYKEHQTTMETREVELKAQAVEFQDAKVKLENAELTGSTPSDVAAAFMGEIQDEKFKPTAKGLGHQALAKERLVGRLETRTAFSSEEISNASSTVAEQMIKFNKKLQALTGFESASKAYEASAQSLAKAIQDTAKKLKIDKPDVSGLNNALKEAANVSKDVASEMKTIIDKLKRFDDIT